MLCLGTLYYTQASGGASDATTEIHLHVQGDLAHPCGPAQIAMNDAVLESNVILGFASGYGRSHLHILLSSFQRQVAGASLLLFVNHLPEPAIAMDGVVFVVADLSEFSEYYVPVSRFATYKCFLEAAQGIERVLYIDTRDLVFQANPFDAYTDGNVHFFQEASSVSIEENSYNRAWLHSCSTPEIAQHFGGFPVQNSGCVIGPKAAIHDYATLMATRLQSTGCRFDQGMHNILLYTAHGELKFSFTVESNEVGRWFTGHAAADTYIWDGQSDRKAISKVTNKVYVAMHQFDRIPELKAHFEALYALDS